MPQYTFRDFIFLGGGGAKRVPLQIALFVRPSDPLRVISKDHWLVAVDKVELSNDDLDVGVGRGFQQLLKKIKE